MQAPLHWGVDLVLDGLAALPTTYCIYLNLLSLESAARLQIAELVP